VLAASIIRAIITLMKEAGSTPETSVNFYQTTQRNNPEDSHLHMHHRENLKSHRVVFGYDMIILPDLKRKQFYVTLSGTDTHTSFTAL
jgi:hypothetical protein